MNESHTGTYLGFYIGEVKFAIDVFNVLSIQELTKVTKLPKTPADIMGLIKHQDKSIPLVDTALKLGLGKVTQSSNTSVIILEHSVAQEEQVAIVVDSVQDVFQVDKHSIIPLPSKNGLTAEKFIQGMIPSEEDFTIIMHAAFVFEENILEEFPALSKSTVGSSTHEKQTF